jgi:hypothetical protein
MHIVFDEAFGFVPELLFFPEPLLIDMVRI